MSPGEELERLLPGLDSEQRDLVGKLAADLSTGDAGARADLFTVVHRLDDKQVAKLLDVARVMAQPIDEWINADSKVLRPEFVAEFRARLQAHHATHTTQMDRLGFENAFLSASRAAGRDAAEAPHYELVEIPVRHFERVKELSVSDFDSDAPRIMISDDEGEIMEFRLDRSDSKITIGKISKSRCVVHAEWRLALEDGRVPLQ